uniref:CX domain-containing protein n=1 Tax=Caenorhabditis japonica TaxID=281687 RepID=A0A8R1DU36_CAEJA
MRISYWRKVCLLLLFLSFVYHTAARGRGGRGRGGRGRSGSRGGMRAKSSIIKSNIRGSSSISGGVRSGTSGFKVGTSTSTTSNYGSLGFRSAMLGSSYHPSVHRRVGHPFVIVAATIPMFYDNRNYYWSYNMAMFNNTVTKSNIICEYVFGSDDGELSNITFKNGTAARSIYFGCKGMVECCGMYCCHDFHQYFELAFLAGFVLIFLGIAYYAKKREPVRVKKSKSSDTFPLNGKSSTALKPTANTKLKLKPKTSFTQPTCELISKKSLPIHTTTSNPQPSTLPQAPPVYGFIQLD